MGNKRFLILVPDNFKYIEITDQINCSLPNLWLKPDFLQYVRVSDKLSQLQGSKALLHHTSEKQSELLSILHKQYIAFKLSMKNMDKQNTKK